MQRWHKSAWLLLAPIVLWAPACGGGGGDGGGAPPDVPGTYFQLTSAPDPTAVFNASTICFRYSNNLTNGIWHANANLVITGDFTLLGYWSHPGNASGYPAAPDNATGVSRFGRMVHMPLTERVAYTVTAGGGNGMGTAPATDLRLAAINRFTGVVGAPVVPVFSDAYAGTCNVLSSSIDELLILENATTIRRYRTSATTATLTFLGTVTLSIALPAGALCTSAPGCFGGSFAWDGAFYYFSINQTLNGNLSYSVYQPNGTFVATNIAAGGGGINGVYFDWSVGRYATHDGFGNRTAALVFDSLAADTDSQCYGDASPNHTFHP